MYRVARQDKSLSTPISFLGVLYQVGNLIESDSGGSGAGHAVHSTEVDRVRAEFAVEQIQGS